MSSHKAPPVIPDPKGYESSDLVLAPIIKWIIFMLVFVAVTTAITIPIYNLLQPKTPIVGDATRFSLERQLPAEPRLQAAPKIEMKDFRIDEAQKVSSYGWADRAKGEVRIPIEKAMEIVAEQGAPGVPVATKNAISEPLSQTAPTETKPAEPKRDEAKPTEEKAVAPDATTKPTNKPAEGTAAPTTPPTKEANGEH